MVAENGIAYDAMHQMGLNPEKLVSYPHSCTKAQCGRGIVAILSGPFMQYLP
jgi:hypothetical protein